MLTYCDLVVSWYTRMFPLLAHTFLSNQLQKRHEHNILGLENHDMFPKGDS